jgi:hypothetical protein
MSPTIRPPQPGDIVPPCLCVLLDLVLRHKLMFVEDVLALGRMHGTDYVAIVDACERAIDRIEPCDENLDAHYELTDQVEKCRRVIR